jgi:hypothetical protein
MKQDFTQQEIVDMLHEETGVQLSRSQIRYDMRLIRKRWMREQDRNYGAMLNEELARLDSMEYELWRSWRASRGEVQKTRVEKIMSETGGDVDPDLIVAKIIEETKEVRGDPSILKLIIQNQQERRKLLGLYAPSKIGLDIRKEERKIAVKGYIGLSPSDWPGEEKTRKEIEEAIEGEFERSD